jgi:hypothetical protein
MPFKAILKLAGNEFEVLNCNYNFRRDVDAKGNPSSGIYGGSVNVTIASTDDTSVIEAMINSQHKTLDGSIEFKKGDDDAKMKELEFKKGYIVQFSEGMDSVGTEAMTQNFTISAEEMKLGSAAHHNNWPKK